MFVHLHVHSHFSFKDATPSPQALAKKAAECEMSAVAITDHNTLAGAVRFYKACRETGVKPIVGCEVTLDTGQHLVLLAVDLSGYSNLCRLVTAMHLGDPGKEPKAKLTQIASHSAGVICLTGCNHSKFAQATSALAKAFLGDLRDIFPLRLYVELENNLTPASSAVIRRIASYAAEFNLPLVATNNVHFLHPSEHRSRDILTAMGENTTIMHQSSARHPNAERYFKSAQQMREVFAHYPEAIANTLVIAEQCNLKLPLGQYHFPYFSLPPGQDGFSYLRELAFEGARERYPNTALPAERLEYELAVIKQLGFVEYFLVMWDIVNFARREGIRCAGRGSAADSLVAYVLGMTSVDPVAHALLFERFLNPERQGMPDIDIDFDSARRDEVLAYVYHRYAADKVAMVGTVNTFNARSALREVAKALALPPAEIDRLAKLMPHTAASNIRKAIDTLPELKNFPRGKLYQEILDICADLDGAPRHLSVHLGGVVVSRDALTDLVPLQWSAKGVIITQYDKDDIEALGLVKMDLLGLRILSAMQSTVDSLRAEGTELCLESLPLDDEKTYELLRSTRTVGVFQLESPGMRELLGRLQPTQFADVLANIALFRPGPMQADMVSPFIARRHGVEAVKFAHPCLAPILGETYGVIIYQEQVLQVAAVMAGFTLGQADLLRRAMTRHCPPEQMERIRQDFRHGCQARGIDAEVTEQVFAQLSAFAAYGFNKAHAATFGLTAYHTAYLKAHYPAHFLASLLNHQPMGYYPARVILNEARVMGIKILPLDILQSSFDSTVEDGAIRVGLKHIAALTREHYHCLETRREAATWSTFSDALEGLPFPLAVWEKLREAGALDRFGPRSKLTQTLLAHFAGDRRREAGHAWSERLLVGEEAAGYAEQDNGYGKNDETGLAVSLKERLWGELNTTGLCYTAHPLALFATYFSSLKITPSRELDELPHGTKVRAAGMIVSRQTPPTRSKQRVIFLTMEDHTGLIDVAVFAAAQEKYARYALTSTLLLVEGTLRKTGVCGASITALRVLDLREAIRGKV